MRGFISLFSFVVVVAVVAAVVVVVVVVAVLFLPPHASSVSNGSMLGSVLFVLYTAL